MITRKGNVSRGAYQTQMQTEGPVNSCTSRPISRCLVDMYLAVMISYEERPAGGQRL